MLLGAPEVGPDADHPLSSPASVAHLEARARVGIRSVQYGDDDFAILQCLHQACEHPLGKVGRALELLVVPLREEDLEGRTKPLQFAREFLVEPAFRQRKDRSCQVDHHGVGISLRQSRQYKRVRLRAQDTLACGEAVKVGGRLAKQLAKLSGHRAWRIPQSRKSGKSEAILLEPVPSGGYEEIVGQRSSYSSGWDSSPFAAA